MSKAARLQPVLRAPGRRGRGQRPTRPSATRLNLLLDILTPIAKSWPAQWCLAANDLAIQIHGGYGYTREYKVEQFYRDNRLNPIHEGTHGIQALDLLGRKVVMHDGAAFQLYAARVEATIVARARDCGLAANTPTRSPRACAPGRSHRATLGARAIRN